MISRILCLIGQHRRSRHHARYDGMDWVSTCSRCGIKMRKDVHRGWLVEADATAHKQ